ncbi:aldo/keto reductase [Candidatus Protofrankia californiensis]|uniref:aldo/keto reductase n=1 Tax=Candidatus Protofrankia californiensis TaxID=1839754 RepID=UPI001041A1BF|nr:aldo/keto reductase [Candidatus Protofrankia californiensis]
MHPPDRRIILGLYRTRHNRGILEAALEQGIQDLDTAFNYADFSSLDRLAAIAPDLISEFRLSTKVGFFPSATGRAEHSLNPIQLRQAIEVTADTLGRTPDVIFLHNPERSVTEAGREIGYGLLTDAAETLERAVHSGLCAAWGISTWEPRPLVEAIRHRAELSALPTHLMHRSGVLVSSAVMEATDSLAELLRVGVDGRWGMSPFGGDTRLPFWDTLSVGSLLSMQGPYNPVEAAFRLAYELPNVERVSVSLNDPMHLAQLVEATRLSVDPVMLERYRKLLRSRQRANAS